MRWKKALEARKEEMGILAAKDNKETAAFADVLFLAVKPQYYQSVIEGNQGYSEHGSDPCYHCTRQNTGMACRPIRKAAEKSYAPCQIPRRW